jgi:hypothetical protein
LPLGNKRIVHAPAIGCEKKDGAANRNSHDAMSCGLHNAIVPAERKASRASTMSAIADY